MNSKSLIVTHINYSSRGGAGRAALRLHQALLELGWLSFFLSVDNAEDIVDIPNTINLNLVEDWLTEEERLTKRFFDYINWDYIQENRTDISNTRFSFSYPGIDILSLPIIQASDIIHLHWIPDFVTPVAIKKLALKGKKIVWTFHDQWAMTGGCHYDAGCQRYQTDCRSCPQLQVDPFYITESVLEDKKRQFEDVDITVVTPSKWLGEWVRKSWVFKDKRVEVLPNPLETDIFCPPPEEERINNKRLLFGDDCFVILFGNDYNEEKRKGFAVLAEVIEVCQRNPLFSKLVKEGKIAIEIFGNSPPQKEIAGVPVFHLGNLDRDEKLVTAMNLGDIFLFPSLQDNYPNTVVEAMSCGLPVMAFNTGGLPDLIEHEVNGFLVEPVGSAPAFAATLLRVIENRDNLTSIRARVRPTVTPSHDFQVLGKKFIDLYLSLGLEGKRNLPVDNSSSLAGLFDKVNCTYDFDLTEAFLGQRFKGEILETVLPNFQKLVSKSWQSWQLYINQLYPELLEKIPRDSFFDLYLDLADNLQGQGWLSPEIDSATGLKWTTVEKNAYLTPQISLEFPLLLTLTTLGLPPQDWQDNFAIYANNLKLSPQTPLNKGGSSRGDSDNTWQLTALIPKEILQLSVQLYLRFSQKEAISSPIKIVSAQLEKQIDRSARINLTENFLGVGWHSRENSQQQSQGKWMGKTATISCNLLLTPLTEIVIHGSNIAKSQHLSPGEVLASLQVWLNGVLVEETFCHWEEDNSWLWRGRVALITEEVPTYCTLKLGMDGYLPPENLTLLIQTVEILPLILDVSLAQLNILPRILNNIPTLPRANSQAAILVEEELTLDMGELSNSGLMVCNLMGKCLEVELSEANLSIHLNDRPLDYHYQSFANSHCLLRAEIPQELLEGHNRLKILAHDNTQLQLSRIYLHPQIPDKITLRANSSFYSQGFFPGVVEDRQTQYRWLENQSQLDLPLPLSRDYPWLLSIHLPLATNPDKLKNLQVIVNHTPLEGLSPKEGCHYHTCIFPSTELEDLKTRIQILCPADDDSRLLFQQLTCQPLDKLETQIIHLDSSLQGEGWYDAQKQEDKDGNAQPLRWMGKQAEITIPTDTLFGFFPINLKIKGVNYINRDILTALKVSVNQQPIEGEIKNTADNSWEFAGIIPNNLLQQQQIKGEGLNLVLSAEKVKFIGDNLQPFSVAVSQIILTPILTPLYQVNLTQEFIGCGWQNSAKNRGKEFRKQASVLMTYPDGLFVEFAIHGCYPSQEGLLEKLSITINQQPLLGEFDYSDSQSWCFRGIIGKKDKFDGGFCVVDFTLDADYPLEIISLKAAIPEDSILSNLTTEVDYYLPDKTLVNLQQYHWETICTKFIELASIEA